MLGKKERCVFSLSSRRLQKLGDATTKVFDLSTIRTNVLRHKRRSTLKYSTRTNAEAHPCEKAHLVSVFNLKVYQPRHVAAEKFPHVIPV